VADKYHHRSFFKDKTPFLAYPYGSWGNFNDRDKKIVRSAGYEAALSTLQDTYSWAEGTSVSIKNYNNFSPQPIGLCAV